MKTLRQAVGFRIKTKREKLYFSQRQLAKKVGTSNSVISRLENGGDTSYSIEDLERYAIALNCSLKDLIPDPLENGDYL